jgi:hypothetical protein
MTLLIMTFPPATYHFIPVRSKYSPRHPAYCLPLMLEAKFHNHTKLQAELICIVLIYVFREQTRKQKLGPEW